MATLVGYSMAGVHAGVHTAQQPLATPSRFSMAGVVRGVTVHRAFTSRFHIRRGLNVDSEALGIADIPELDKDLQARRLLMIAEAKNIMESSARFNLLMREKIRESVESTEMLQDELERDFPSMTDLKLRMTKLRKRAHKEYEDMLATVDPETRAAVLVDMKKQEKEAKKAATNERIERIAKLIEVTSPAVLFLEAVKSLLISVVSKEK